MTHPLCSPPPPPFITPTFLHISGEQTFTPTLARLGCSACPAGYESLLNDSSSCQTCPGGKFGNRSSDPSVEGIGVGCEKCPLGFFRRNDWTATVEKLTSCVRCPRGWVNPYLGMSLCVECERGLFQSRAGEIKCAQCNVHHYSGNAGQHACTACPAGFEALASGSNQCPRCSEGMRANSTSPTSLGCIPCDPGRFRPNGHLNSLTCQLCPTGFKNPVPQQGQCLACEAGRFQREADSTVCNDCPVNTFTDLSAKTACTTCPTGWYTPVPSASVLCDTCAVGRHRTDKLLPTVTNCTNCRRGRFRRADDTTPVAHLLECELAPAGWYQPSAEGRGFSLLW